MGDYYLDGPVLLKSGIKLVGIVSEDSPFNTAFFVHGSGTGADGVIIADGVSDALVRIFPVIGESKRLVRTTPPCRRCQIGLQSVSTAFVFAGGSRTKCFVDCTILLTEASTLAPMVGTWGFSRV